MTNTISVGESERETELVTEGYRCYKCDKPFTLQVEMPMEMGAYIKRMKSIKCPLCGAKGKNIGLGLGLSTEENLAILETEGVSGASVQERASAWFAKGETGLSSKCIARFMLCEPNTEINWPHDPSDLRRCVMLLDLIPEWRSKIPSMFVLGGGWAKLAPRWNEVVSLFRTECPEYVGKAPQTYALIQQLTTV